MSTKEIPLYREIDGLQEANKRLRKEIQSIREECATLYIKILKLNEQLKQRDNTIVELRKYLGENE
jgi:predicted  nucleic acid-binding Zn-ribbon protein